MKSIYQYKPFQDSLLGRILFYVYEQNNQDTSILEKAIDSNLAEGTFFTGTKNTEKQVLFRILPDKFRSFIKNKEHDLLIKEFGLLVRGDSNNLPKIDMAFEILEWILSGFEEPDLILKLLIELTNYHIHFDSEFVRLLIIDYNKEIQKEISNMDP